MGFRAASLLLPGGSRWGLGGSPCRAVGTDDSVYCKLGNGRMCPRTLRTLVTQFARAITLALATILGGSTSMPAQLGPSETLRTALAALARRDWRSLAALIDPRALDS